MTDVSSPSLTILTGASRGLGLALARQVLQRGGTLLTLSRQPLQALAAEAAQAGATLIQWSQDLADAPAAAARLAAWLRGQAPNAYASATLINNAGVIPRIGALMDAEAADLANAMRVGLEAPLLLSAAFLDATRTWAGPRKLLNISSGLGRRPMAAQAPYCAAKAGMDHFTRCLALEEAARPHGARVCSLAPGVVDTDMQHQLRSASPHDFPDQSRFAALKNQGHLASAEDTARRVLAYLARPDFGAEPVADIRDAS
ncbi:MAG: SDR family NAD(P)-dependent oxidoreductase [Comamonadaceae bacterium]|nr:SDR family NAD(P)-dependent oxidoreductase [Comamonadaceae bacterium]